MLYKILPYLKSKHWKMSASHYCLCNEASAKIEFGTQEAEESTLLSKPPDLVI